MSETPILLVDDDAALLEALADALSSLPVQVETAAGGPEALARLRERNFAVVVTDVHVPRVIRVRRVQVLQSKEHAQEDAVPFRMAAVVVSTQRRVRETPGMDERCTVEADVQDVAEDHRDDQGLQAAGAQPHKRAPAAASGLGHPEAKQQPADETGDKATAVQ